MTTISQANRDVRTWCLETAGKRKHGTIQEQPLKRFEEVERAHLTPLPPAPYDMGIWKLLKLHRDCHVVFEGAYYSAPFEQIGQQLRVRGGITHVRIYGMDYQLIATHERAAKPSERLTHPDHLPAHKRAGLQISRESCLKEAATTGEHVFQVVQILLDDPVVDRLRTAGRLLRLAERYGEARLEVACERAIAFDDPAYMTIKRILTQNLDQSALPPEPQPVPLARAFVRNVVELVGSLGGVSWN